jgi:hypothetical protein
VLRPSNHYQTNFRRLNPKRISSPQAKETKMKTINMLLAHFGGNPIIPIEEAAQYLKYKPDTLKQKIDGGDIRLPYFSLEDNSQKAQKFVMLPDMAQLIDVQFFAAREKFTSICEDAALG